MSESQSRYSIIERLTDKKLALMNEMDSLELSAKEARQKAGVRQTNLESDKLAISERNSQEIKYLEKQIQDLKNRSDIENNRLEAQVVTMLMEANNLSDNVGVKKESLASQILAIEAALVRLEEISKSAVQ
jgi:hypothetical protein